MKFFSNKLKLILFGLFLYFLLIVIVGIITYNKNIRNNFDNTGHIERATLITKNRQKSDIKIPSKIDTLESFEFEFDIKQYIKMDNLCISTRSNFANFYAYADDKLIFEKKSNINDFIGSGSFHLIFFELPKNLKSPIIKIRIEPLVKDLKDTYLSEILIGEKTDLIMNKLFNEFNTLAFCVIMLINFIIILVVALFNKSFFKQENYGVLHLSILGLFLSVYFFTQTWLVKYLFISSNTLIYLIEFTSLPAIPIPILAFFKYKLDVKYKKIYTYMISLLIANIVIQTLICILRKKEYVQMLTATHILILISMFMIIYTFIHTDKKKYPNKKDTIILLVVAIPTMPILILLYILTGQIYFDKVALIISMAFVVIEMKELFTKYYSYKEDLLQGEKYKLLANTDALTGLKNRLSYNSFLTKFVTTNDIKTAWIVSIDVNGLKKINDAYGHLKGDELLKSFASLLKNEENKKDNITTYRIGGDEFFVLIEASEHFFIEDWIAKLREECLKLEHSEGLITPSFSAGFYYYDYKKDKKEDIEKFYKMADERMYEEKRKYKFNLM